MVSGWGHLKSKGGATSPTLLETEVKVVSNEGCTKMLTEGEVQDTKLLFEYFKNLPCLAGQEIFPMIRLGILWSVLEERTRMHVRLV